MVTESQSLKSSERVEPEEFSRRVASKLGEGAGAEARFGHIYVKVERERVVEAVRILKEDPDLQCTYLTFLSAVDWEDRGFEVLIVLWSFRFANTVIVKVEIPAEQPSVHSITGVFLGAAWHERETYEMFGIRFDGHPDLKNLYLPDDFEGNPLRKSFKLASRLYKSWPGAKDPGEAEAGGR